MTREQAAAILGLGVDATADQARAARRQLIAALHPDRHDGGDRDVFNRLSADINLAARVLLESRDSDAAEGVAVDGALVDVRVSASWVTARTEKTYAVAPFSRRYAADGLLAISALGIDTNFEWQAMFAGRTTVHVGTALYLVVGNRTRVRADCLTVSKGVLIDDIDHQYSSDGRFYWRSRSESGFHCHDTQLVPLARIDGFLLYPELRSGASYFKRWYLAAHFQVGDDWVTADYDIALPAGPQFAAERYRLTGSVNYGENGGWAESVAQRREIEDPKFRWKRARQRAAEGVRAQECPACSASPTATTPPDPDRDGWSIQEFECTLRGSGHFLRVRTGKQTRSEWEEDVEATGLKFVTGEALGRDTRTLLSTRVDDLDLSIRAIRTLIRAGIANLRQLAEQPAEFFANLRPPIRDEILYLIDSCGMNVGMRFEDQRGLLLIAGIGSSPDSLFF